MPEALDREPIGPFLWLPSQQVVYRQLMYFVNIPSIVTAIVGATLRWHRLERRSEARIVDAPAR